MVNEEESEDSRDHSSDKRAKYVDRAPRFPIEASVAFRAGGEYAWHQGTSINISRTGVLFKSNQAFDPKTVLEMRIAFPPELTGDAETNVVCWGRVVRKQPFEEEPFHSVAASIFRYRFKRD